MASAVATRRVCKCMWSIETTSTLAFLRMSMSDHSPDLARDDLKGMDWTDDVGNLRRKVKNELLDVGAL